MNFFGCPYPITKNARGLLRTQTGISQVKSDILCLLLTYPGERPMLPEFGTPLRDLIFDQNDDVIVDKAKEMISRSIQRWEPRVIINSIDVVTQAEQYTNDNIRLNNNGHVLGIFISFYDPENINQLQSLKLDLPLAGT